MDTPDRWTIGGKRHRH